MDRTQLKTHFENLDAAVPALLKINPDRCHFWLAFDGMANLVEGCAIAGDDAQFVSRLLDEILAWHGLQDTDRSFGEAAIC
ncbi:hypothetical protein FHR59_001867 [Xanthomonas arboricola]|uniref:hypothetical protein n=1 Tax=Xanthomonas TaxID=338 RepID=UPI0015CAD816|nr:hypothetical protein [Xanthomonas arboricola]MBB5675181.1 hypothetical protein [Xanthomonas arboricola]MBB6337657.1 hypothetical protein [Xanthomonas arboricola]